MSEVLNAQITNVSLGYDDHGIFTFGLTLHIAGGLGCVFGGYALDTYNEELKKRVCNRYSIECLTEIMKTVGVEKWEQLQGKYLRVVYERREPIKKIGNLMKDQWFDIEEFFEKCSDE